MKIANELVEQFARIRISGEASQVLWVVFRKTYGFNKKEDAISLSQFTSATGLKKNAVCKALNKLKAMGIITQKENAVANIYRITKDFDLWKPLPKKVTVPKKRMAVPQKENNRTPKRDTQKTVTKDTITKDILAPQSVAEEIVQVIDAFKEVNPSYKKWFANKTQRASAERMVQTHGLAHMLSVIAFLPKSNIIPYLPTITTPVQLEDKYAALEASLKKKKNESLSKQKGYIL